MRMMVVVESSALDCVEIQMLVNEIYFYISTVTNSKSFKVPQRLRVLTPCGEFTLLV